MIALILSLLISTLLLVKGTPTSSSENSTATSFQMERQSAASNSTNSTEEYLKKICEDEPTCHLIDQVPSDLRSLETRNCMCDAKCSTYGDCCLDSKYYNETEQRINFRKFFCMPFYRIYAIVTCPSTYTNAEVKYKCELSGIWPPTNGTEFQTPVTNTELGRTYGNEYCALCNSVREFQAWDVSFLCINRTIVDAKHVSFNLAKNRFVSFHKGSESDCMPTRSWNSPDLKLRSCIDGISTCPPGNESELCESRTAFVGTIGSNPKMYRNRYCAECNGNTHKFWNCQFISRGPAFRSVFSNEGKLDGLAMTCGNLRNAVMEEKFCHTSAATPSHLRPHSFGSKSIQTLYYCLAVLAILFLLD